MGYGLQRIERGISAQPTRGIVYENMRLGRREVGMQKTGVAYQGGLEV